MKEIADRNLIQPYTRNRRFGIGVKSLNRRRHRLRGTLLVLLASGMLFNNILFFSFADYPVTPSIVLTAVLYLLFLGDWLDTGKPLRISVFLSTLTLLVYEFVVHGILMDRMYEGEWVRSFALLVVMAGLLLVSSRATMSKYEGSIMVKTTAFTAYILGGLGIIQIILSNVFGVVGLTFLPESTLLRVVDVISDSDRFAGLIRAYGVSYEFSYYGIGMVVIVALSLVLLELFPLNHRDRFFRIGAIYAALAGVAASLSFTAWALLLAIMIIWIVNNLRSGGRGIHRVLIVSIVLFVVFIVLVLPYFAERWLFVASGTDHSLLQRFVISIDLIVHPGSDFSSSLAGTGIGLDQLNFRVFEAFSRYLNQAWLEYIGHELTIVNGVAYIAVTMGWIGLALHGWIIHSVFYRKGSRLLYPVILFALVVGYFFTNARYLWPEWWAILIIVMLLKDFQISQKTAQAMAGANGSPPIETVAS